MWSIFGCKLYFGFFGIDLGSFISKVFVDVTNASGSESSLLIVMGQVPVEYQWQFCLVVVVQ